MAYQFGGYSLCYVPYYYGPYPIPAYPGLPTAPVASDVWLLDSGATNHCTNAIKWLENTRHIIPTAVSFANGQSTVAQVTGTVNIDENGFRVDDVLLLPGTTINLLSVGCLTDAGHTVVFRKNGCEVFEESEFVVDGCVTAVGRRVDRGQYILMSKAPEPLDQTLWHRRLGHISMSDLLLLQSRLATGIIFSNDINIIMCSVNSCPNYSIPPAIPVTEPIYDLIMYPRTTRILEVVYFFWMGPYLPSFLDGHRYIAVFIDDYSRKCFSYFFNTHRKLPQLVLGFKKQIESVTNLEIGVIKSAHESTCSERDCRRMKKFMARSNIPYQHSYIRNDIITESRFRIYEKMITFLKDAKMNFIFWAEAAIAVMLLINVTPNKIVTNVTPEEMWSGSKPDVSTIRVFGCKAYSYTYNKFAIHLWYNTYTGFYQLLDVRLMQLDCDSNVDFYEDERCFNDDGDLLY